MKRLPIDFVILGRTYASALSDYLTEDSSASVIFYLGESCTYDYFVSQVQPLTKNLYGQMTFIFDTSMIEDKANFTQYFVYLKAIFPSARIIAIAPGLHNRELISNILTCGVYDIINTDLDDSVNEIEAVCRLVDNAIDHPRRFADVYKVIMWRVPVLETSNEPKGLFAKRKARKEAKKQAKLAKRQAKIDAKNVVPEPEPIDPYEAFLNGVNTAKQPEFSTDFESNVNNSDEEIFDFSDIFKN